MMNSSEYSPYTPAVKGPIRTMLSANWTMRLRILLFGIMLGQFVIWLSNYWLSDTTTIVWIVLVMVALTEWMAFLPRLARYTIQLGSIFYLMYYTLDFAYYESSSQSRIADTFSWLVVQLEQFSIYLPFALAAWLLYIFLLRFVDNKIRLFSVILNGVLIFAIVDSYSIIVLWDQVAIYMFCGLILLVLQHFTELKKSNPAGWGKIADYLPSISTTVILFVSLLIMAGVVTPEVRPVLKDPYTWWNEMQGRDVILPGKGPAADGGMRGGLSGYSRNDEQLGGGFSFDYSPVMTVNSNHRAYWRGESRALYTGRGWMSDPREEEAAVRISGAEAMPLSDRYDRELQTVELIQDISILDNAWFPVLFAAFEPEQIVAASEVVSSVGWIEATHTLLWEDDNQFPRSYRVVSRMPMLDEERLRNTVMELSDDEIWDAYLELPDIPQRVIDLTMGIIDGHDNPYDQARAIESYLRQTFPYTTTPDLSLARSDDFVDSFLFEVQEGYCDFYSTAMVVMSRIADLPARWVKGFASGTQPLDDFGFLPEELGGSFTVRNADAHSWVEIYFPGSGWVSFEPTSGFTAPLQFVGEDGEPIQDVFESTAPPVIVDDGWNWRAPQVLRWTVIALMIAAALYFLYKYALQRGWMRLSWQKSKLENGNELVVEQLELLFRKLARKGYIRYPHETVRETFRRWIKQNGWLEQDLRKFNQLFERARYDRRAVSMDDVERAREIREHIMQEL